MAKFSTGLDEFINNIKSNRERWSNLGDGEVPSAVPKIQDRWAQLRHHIMFKGRLTPEELKKKLLNNFINYKTPAQVEIVRPRGETALQNVVEVAKIARYLNHNALENRLEN
jgi:hypothetical protein